jgi:hypothetical protein
MCAPAPIGARLLSWHIFPSLHGEVVRQWGKLVEIAARWPLSCPGATLLLPSRR